MSTRTSTFHSGLRDLIDLSDLPPGAKFSDDGTFIEWDGSLDEADLAAAERWIGQIVADDLYPQDE